MSHCLLVDMQPPVSEHFNEVPRVSAYRRFDCNASVSILFLREKYELMLHSIALCSNKTGPWVNLKLPLARSDMVHSTITDITFRQFFDIQVVAPHRICNVLVVLVLYMKSAPLLGRKEKKTDYS